MRIKGSLNLIGLLPILLLLIAGCSGKGDAIVKPVFTGARVQYGTLQNQELLNGKLEAVQSASVVSKATGKVQEVKVDIGTAVQQGQVLMNLEAGDLEANIELAQAAADSAQIICELAARNFERGKELLASGALSQAAFDDNYEGAYRKAEAALRSARASLQKARIAYNDTFIRAPFSGVVTAKNVNPGEIVLPQAPVISMVNLNQVLVKVAVDETRINRFKDGETAMVTVAAAASGAFNGIITAIAPATDPQTKAYTVKIQVDNPQHVLKPGMFAEVKIEDQPLKGLMVPKAACLIKEGANSVFVVKNGRIEKRAIEPGASGQRDLMVLSGLSEGEQVILRPPAGLRDGQQAELKIND